VAESLDEQELLFLSEEVHFLLVAFDQILNISVAPLYFGDYEVVENLGELAVH